jgi:hypothetical protein
MIGTTVVRWATHRTGFDSIQSANEPLAPSVPAGTTGMITAEAAPIKRQDYCRAQAACLEGRSYSVN